MLTHPIASVSKTMEASSRVSPLPPTSGLTCIPSISGQGRTGEAESGGLADSVCREVLLLVPSAHVWSQLALCKLQGHGVHLQLLRAESHGGYDE